MERNVVDVHAFIHNLEKEFDDPIPGGLHPSTCFRDLGDWTSLQALIVVASFEREYGVTLAADELDGATTVEDLHGVVLRRMGR